MVNAFSPDPKMRKGAQATRIMDEFDPTDLLNDNKNMDKSLGIDSVLYNAMEDPDEKGEENYMDFLGKNHKREESHNSMIF
jgi:hypothetical protein